MNVKERQKPKIFKDKNGHEIKVGDILLRKFFVRKRERPGHKRVAINPWNNEESIVLDEGELLEPELHWIARRVYWFGACMIAERFEYSDFDMIVGDHAMFDENNNRTFESSNIEYMNDNFNSSVYEIIDHIEDI